MLTVFITILTVLLVIASVLLILIILMQRPKQEGLGAAFGGGMMDSIAGAHTTDILQKGTVWLAVFFLTASIFLAVLRTREIASQNVGDVLEGVKREDMQLPLGPAPSISDLPRGLDLEPGADPLDPMALPPGETPATSLLDSPTSMIDDAPKPAEEQGTPAGQPAPASEMPKADAEQGDKGAKEKAKGKEPGKGKAKAGAEAPAEPAAPGNPAGGNSGPGANN